MDDDATWHRKFGTELVNDCPELIEKSNRSGDDDIEMLLVAAASRWH